MKKLLAPLFLALAALLIGGCASNTKTITAGLQVELARVQRADNGDLQVTWRVRNPNVVHYVLSRVSFKIALDGQSVGELTETRRVGVPSLNQIEQTSVLPAGAVANAAALEQALARGSAAYNLNATVWILLLDDKEEKVRIDASGTVTTGAP